MDKNTSNRGQWASNIGFILAAAGSAVGLGNIWKFPYLAGANGGGAFVVIYLVMIVIIGFVIMLGEMAIGRNTHLSSVGAYKKLSEKWAFVGFIGVVVGFCILAFYSVIGGWVLNYIGKYLIGGISGAEAGNYFSGFIASTTQPIVWHLVFMVLCCVIVLKGIAGGIEKASKFMMPALFILLVIIAIRSVTLDGAMEGIKFFIKPDFSKVTIGTVMAALGQAFFSLSLGMGAIITYGSYLGNTENLEKNAVIIPAIDTAVALLAGFAVLPAVFAFGFEPGAGPSLMFITLPSVFDSMPFGQFFGILFFILILFAALTSAISLLEVVVAFVIDTFKIERKKATIIISTILFFIGIPCSLANGPVMKDVLIFGYNFFDFMSFLAENLLMPLGGLLMCIFIGYVWGVDNISDEISCNGKYRFRSKQFFVIMIKYIAPVLIFIIWLNAIGVLPYILKIFGITL
ncbi:MULTISPECIES: sodium-dependent transporter [unclassified Clostridium]|uniref:sodium-dependent transporter n=1 Tax=unclassified Clostridium TaxID=2614128 RepID=UPI0032179BD2|nr:sodium-dependent transporter [Escherichia coli]HAY3977738.1 sodium-dependent transporter [Escherichia coli]HBB9211999.1 sodium-dependent transporter [Escherichia coli]